PRRNIKRRSLRQSDDSDPLALQIAVACLLRTTDVGARTVPDRLQSYEPMTTRCGRPLRGFLAPDFLVCDPSQAMRRPDRSIAARPETVKSPEPMMAKMPNSCRA